MADVFVRSDAVNPPVSISRKQLIDAVGLGGHTYARTRDQSDIEALTPQE